MKGMRRIQGRRMKCMRLFVLFFGLFLLLSFTFSISNSSEMIEDHIASKGVKLSTTRNTSSSSNKACEDKVQEDYTKYYQYSLEGERLRKAHGTLRIAGFSRLWVPPLHGTGGMQYHALHLYSQLAAFGHEVHVFVTGPPDDQSQKTLRMKVDPISHVAELLPNDSEEEPLLTVHQVPSDHNGEYSVQWYKNCLAKFSELNASLAAKHRGVGFHVAHSESWAGVPNIFQLGIQMAVTWHGSMLDWFRNEINKIVHNFRMNRKMTQHETSERMKSLGPSVAYEAYALLTIPRHIVISDSASDDLKQINLIEKERVHLIYNGVNSANFRPADDRNAVRREFLQRHKIEYKEGVFLVGCGGRLEGIKGHHQLSEAMRIVFNHHSNVILFVAGKGPEERRYNSLRKEGFSVVMLGMVGQEELSKFYQSLDVFIDAFYQHHGLNTVMLEAVLSGVPIIASNLASSKTTIPCPSFGTTFTLGSPLQIAEAIHHYINNENDRIRVSKNVRLRAVKLFSSTIMANSYESVLYDAFLHPMPLEPILGKVVCQHTYPAMCYREPN